ncbi:hypothetical protein, partial [Phaeovulum veldkampii]|uniref:hypothetical protein n=1 Tax=Phaeovulum veldkampii TaxID=33049 RepID=UPI001A92DBAB
PLPDPDPPVFFGCGPEDGYRLSATSDDRRPPVCAIPRPALILLFGRRHYTRLAALWSDFAQRFGFLTAQYLGVRQQLCKFCAI